MPALAVLLELAARAQQLRLLLGERVHEREALALQKRIGRGLAVVFLQLRLVVEQLELARAARHEQIDDVVDCAAGSEACSRPVPSRAKQSSAQGHLAHTHTAVAEELASRSHLQQSIFGVIAFIPSSRNRPG